MKIAAALYLTLLTMPLWPQTALAQSKTERALQEQLATIQGQLDRANTERLALTAALRAQTQVQAANNITATKSQTAAHDQRSASDSLAVDNAIVAQQAAVAAAVASATSDALTKGRSEQQQATSDRGLYVTLATQFFTLLIGLCAFGYSQITSRQKRRWDKEDREAQQAEEIKQRGHINERLDEQAAVAKNQGATIDQIHVLVNSKMTDAMERELAALREVQQLLQGNITNLTSQGVAPAASLVEAEEMARDRVTELAAILVGRAKQTRRADAVREAEAQPSSKPPDAQPSKPPQAQASNLNGPRKDPNAINSKLGAEILGEVKVVHTGVDTLLDKS